MSRTYKPTTITIGDTMGDLEITGIEQGKRLKETYYNYRCSCGAEGKMRRHVLIERTKEGVRGCRECSKKKKGMEYAYQQAVADMAFVDQHWKITQMTGKHG